MRRKREVLTRYLRFDHHVQKLRLSGKLAEIREQFKIPPDGFRSLLEKEEWEERTLWFSKSSKKAWERVIAEALKIAELPDTYYKNIEILITLDFDGGYDMEQPGIPHHRTDVNFLRAKKLIELSQKTDPKTHKKIEASKVAELYQPDPNTTPLKDYDRFINSKLSVQTGDQVRKIISKYKKRVLKPSKP